MMEQRVETGRTLLEEAEEDKAAVVAVLKRKAMTVGDEKVGEALYVMASILERLPIVVTLATPVMGTDGKHILVGPFYRKVKEKYGEGVVMFLFLHEVLHVIHAHHIRVTLVPNRELYNIVADLYVNTRLSKFIPRIPPTFVTLKSFVGKLGRKIPLTPKQRKVLEELAVDVAEGKVTAEQAYKVIEELQPVAEALEKWFSKSLFTGKDLSKRSPCKDDKRGGGVEGVKRRLEQLRRHVNRMLREIERLRGEYQALRRAHSILAEKQEGRDKTLTQPHKKVGTAAGVLGEEEYREMERLRVELERVLSGEVGRYVVRVRYNYSRLNEDTYWLPVEEVEKLPELFILVDVSRSISPAEREVFTSWLSAIARKYGVKPEFYEFSHGIVAKRKVERKSVKFTKGTGTVWEESVAELFDEARRKMVPLVIVLSDFYIEVTEAAQKAIQRYKRKGGKISCWSTEGNFLDFCDTRHRLPRLLKTAHTQ